ncbi:bifunctional DNA primase/polymerase [Actinomadura rayongensis]|uniref:DNA primase/polymerase bifunctional N-terminal domain-containing protein n=1 Tax=Actinomadura rayongensis TaxID=1429076 RepID=A0A6I4WDU0_9ACTN|nr:bifunctional DNA primase/polymerase [Actinomadura rayongensis]MXQ64862.1 hypothetical protein [Actinomadura rayongensis]
MTTSLPGRCPPHHADRSVHRDSTPEPTTTPLKAALMYARWNWPVMAGTAATLDDGSSRIDDVVTPTVDPERVHRWWGSRPDASIVVPTGAMFDVINMPSPTGRAVLDVLADRGAWLASVMSDGDALSLLIHPHQSSPWTDLARTDGFAYLGPGHLITLPSGSAPSDGRARWVIPPTDTNVLRLPQFTELAPVLRSLPRSSPHPGLQHASRPAHANQSEELTWRCWECPPSPTDPIRFTSGHRFALGADLDPRRLAAEATAPLSVIVQVTKRCVFDCTFCSETLSDQLGSAPGLASHSPKFREERATVSAMEPLVAACASSPAAVRCTVSGLSTAGAKKSGTASVGMRVLARKSIGSKVMRSPSDACSTSHLACMWGRYRCCSPEEARPDQVTGSPEGTSHAGPDAGWRVTVAEIAGSLAPTAPASRLNAYHWTDAARH